MKDRIKKFCKKNEERLVFYSAGLVAGATLGIVYAMSVKRDLEVTNMATWTHRETGDIKFVEILQRNGKYTIFDWVPDPS